MRPYGAAAAMALTPLTYGVQLILLQTDENVYDVVLKTRQKACNNTKVPDRKSHIE